MLTKGVGGTHQISVTVTQAYCEPQGVLGE